MSTFRQFPVRKMIYSDHLKYQLCGNVINLARTLGKRRKRTIDMTETDDEYAISINI